MGNEKIERVGAGRPSRPCPVCRRGHLRRIKREGWVAGVPFLKSYSCSECKANFLRLFNSVQFKVKRSGSVSRKSKRELAVITLTVIITVYLSYRIVVYLYDLGVQHVEQ